MNLNGVWISTVQISPTNFHENVLIGQFTDFCKIVFFKLSDIKYRWLITLACKKKIQRIRLQYSVSFSPAEHEYESHFFPSRQDFPKIYDKGLNINKIGCS